MTKFRPSRRAYSYPIAQGSRNITGELSSYRCFLKSDSGTLDYLGQYSIRRSQHFQLSRLGLVGFQDLRARRNGVALDIRQLPAECFRQGDARMPQLFDRWPRLNHGFYERFRLVAQPLPGRISSRRSAAPALVRREFRLLEIQTDIARALSRLRLSVFKQQIEPVLARDRGWRVLVILDLRRPQHVLAADSREFDAGVSKRRTATFSRALGQAFQRDANLLQPLGKLSSGILGAARYSRRGAAWRRPPQAPARVPGMVLRNRAAKKPPRKWTAHQSEEPSLRLPQN